MYYNLICNFFICTPICTKFYSCKKWVLQKASALSRASVPPKVRAPTKSIVSKSVVAVAIEGRGA
jgi:hypothetical protein